MNAALWTLQPLLASPLLTGGLKMSSYEKFKAMMLLQRAVEAQRTSGFSHLNL